MARMFAPFGDARFKISGGDISQGREMYFGIYQALTTASDDVFRQYRRDFFDLIVIDECHRGSSRNDSSWHAVLDYFEPAIQFGMTATPLREDSRDTYEYFGNPVYSYSLRQGIEDGFLAPYRVHRVITTVDAAGWRPSKDELDRYGRPVPDEEYQTTNPHFGGEEEAGIKANFPANMQTAETALLFLQFIMRKLRYQHSPRLPGEGAGVRVGADRGGRAAVVVPNGTLFGDGVCAVIKEEMLKEFNLHTIVRLPQGVFAPYTDIPANLLFFQRGGPTETLWYYELPLPEGRKKYSKTAPLQFEEFAPVLAWWNAREEGPQAWKVDFAARKREALAVATPHWERAEAERSAVMELGRQIREVEQMLSAASNGEKADLQQRLREVKSRQQAREAAAKEAKAQGDALYWPIYNLDLKNPNARQGLEHADPKDLVASMRAREEDVMRLLAEIESLVSEASV
jgi:type I restriction-modification system DNA methylase subunit